jgi:dCTP deaminase
MLLSRNAILKHFKKGNIVIEPFDDRKLKTTSYDVSLGQYFWREKHPEGGHTIHNIYDQVSTKRIWSGPHQSEPAGKIASKLKMKFANIKPNDEIILLRPNETILAHTEEFIGGKNCCVAKMYARSSLGRNFIEVCKDAGWGDIGYFNRWTMEITNNSNYFTIPLVVGRRIAQMVFYEAEPIEKQDYIKDKLSGKYQSSNNLKHLKKSWNPYMMLPKMHLDWEIKEK